MAAEGFQPKKPFVRPVELPWPEVKALGSEGVGMPRGTEVTRFPQMPAVSVERLKIGFMPSGEVAVPRYAEEAGGLRLERFDLVRDASAAVRRSWHQANSVSAEGSRIDASYRSIQGVHEAVARDWPSYNQAQKTAASGYCAALAEGLQARRGALSEPHKQKAADRLEDASRLLNEGNAGAALASLVGAANDLIARKNALGREGAYLERRGRSIAHEKFIRDKAYYEALDKVIGAEEILTQRQKPQDAELRERARDLGGVAALLGGRRDARLRKCAALASKAVPHVLRWEVGHAIPEVRLAKKTMIEVASESTVLNDERLTWVRDHRDPELKRHIVRNQLRYFVENLDYWLSKAKPEQSEHMRAYVGYLADALGGAKKPRQQESIRKAAGLFGEGKISESKRLMEDAYKGLQD
jgi:hypothetical protein